MTTFRNIKNQNLKSLVPETIAEYIAIVLELLFVCLNEYVCDRMNMCVPERNNHASHEGT